MARSMLKAISNTYHKHATPRRTLFALAGALLLMALLPVISGAYPQGVGNASLDTLRFDSYPEFVTVLEDWGPAGRSFQLWFHLTFDTLFPTTLIVFLGFLPSVLIRRAGIVGRLRYANLIGLAPLFDLLENLLIETSVLCYPDIPPALHILKTGATTLKFGCGIPIAIVLVLLTAKATTRRSPMGRAGA